MKNWKFIDAQGRDTGRTLFCPTREMADANSAPGERAVEFDAGGEQPKGADVTLRRIRDAELMAGQRAIREALLELLPADSPARRRLVEVDAAIAKLRLHLSST